MKCLLTAIGLLLAFQAVYAQRIPTEFGPTNNGLIYPDSTMDQLKHIVDSLHLRFKVCDLNKTYYARPQGIAHYIYLRDKKAWDARKDIDQQLPFDQLQAKYPDARHSRNQLVVQNVGWFRKDTITEYSSVSFTDDREYIEIKGTPATGGQPLQGKWLYQFYDYKEGNALLKAYYFVSDLKSPAVPTKYARKVQYVDCVVDTSSDIYFADASDETYFFPAPNNADSTPSKAHAFLQYVKDRYTASPAFPQNVLDNKTHKAYERPIEKESDRKWSYIRNTLSRTPEFRQKLMQAYEEVRDNHHSDIELETYVELFISPKASLDLKRSRLVYGTCSQDQRPREHAREIARLSAASVNWETFLRAHLNIMNDHFESIAYSNIAQERRATYIRELEVLDINVPDLLIGISLRVGNPAPNHYVGSIGRLGRALAESKDPAKIEQTILDMLRDTTLDDYNRVLMYFLYLNYAHYSRERGAFNAHLARLKAAATTLPAYLAVKTQYMAGNDE